MSLHDQIRRISRQIRTAEASGDKSDAEQVLLMYAQGVAAAQDGRTADALDLMAGAASLIALQMEETENKEIVKLRREAMALIKGCRDGLYAWEIMEATGASSSLIRAALEHLEWSGTIVKKNQQYIFMPRVAAQEPAPDMEVGCDRTE